jgi:hypothetical protein
MSGLGVISEMPVVRLCRFATLLAFIGSPESKMIAHVRSDLTFHYDPKVIERTLASFVAKHPDASGSMSPGDDPHNWCLNRATWWGTAPPCARY